MCPGGVHKGLGRRVVTRTVCEEYGACMGRVHRGNTVGVESRVRGADSTIRERRETRRKC